MKLMKKKTARLVPVMLALMTACSPPPTMYFSAAQDTAVMAELETEFSQSASGGIRLSLCEDRARSDAWNEPGACGEAHVVRGGGRGIEHEEKEPSGIGCGGCPFSVLAYVTATIDGGPFAEPVSLAGEVRMGDLYRPSEVFAYPYTLELARCKEQGCDVRVHGLLYADGRLELEVRRGDFSLLTTARLQAGPAAVCAAR
ncbi:MAG: hypothetical protein GYA21_14840 [Myxococcales bacterium]|nr:hypothetical protein [Myxococcales bacterium]